MASSGRLEQPRESAQNRNGREDQRSLDSLEFILEYSLKIQGTDQAPLILSKLYKRLREAGIQMPSTISTPYMNTIPPEDEPPYPGNRELERRIKSLARWNAMAMVVNAKRERCRGGRPYLQLCLHGHALRSRLQPFLPRRRRQSACRPGLFPGPHHARQLRARLSGMPAGRTAFAAISARNWPRAAGFPRIRIRI